MTLQNLLCTKALDNTREYWEKRIEATKCENWMDSFTPTPPCQACPFQIDVYCEGTQPSIQPLSLDSGPKLLNQALQKSITTRTGAKALRGQDNIFIYTYRGEHRISSLIANKVQ